MRKLVKLQLWHSCYIGYIGYRIHLPKIETPIFYFRLNWNGDCRYIFKENIKNLVFNWEESYLWEMAFSLFQIDLLVSVCSSCCFLEAVAFRAFQEQHLFQKSFSRPDRMKVFISIWSILEVKQRLFAIQKFYYALLQSDDLASE